MTIYGNQNNCIGETNEFKDPHPFILLSRDLIPAHNDGYISDGEINPPRKQDNDEDSDIGVPFWGIWEESG